MIALGGETAGALKIRSAMKMDIAPASRLLPPEELSDRIRDRNHQPFSVWDGKVRLSIAGYQDKISVLRFNGQWLLVDGKNRASTVILKPEPHNRHLSNLSKSLPGTVNEVEAEGADSSVVRSVCEVVTRLCKSHLTIAGLMKSVDLLEFKVEQ